MMKNKSRDNWVTISLLLVASIILFGYVPLDYVKNLEAQRERLVKENLRQTFEIRLLEEEKQELGRQASIRKALLGVRTLPDCSLVLNRQWLHMAEIDFHYAKSMLREDRFHIRDSQITRVNQFCRQRYLDNEMLLGLGHTIPELMRYDQPVGDAPWEE